MKTGLGFWKAPVGEEQSIMTAGQDVAGGYTLTGYSTFPPPFGVLSKQPLAGATMTDLYSISGAASGAEITFSGNATSVLSGKSVWIDGIRYAAGFSGWSFNGTATLAQWTTGAPTFVSGRAYKIEIK